jgi:hypothetical protein
MRTETDAVARTQVLRAYCSLVPNSAKPQEQFDAALACYLGFYPLASNADARQAVAYIIATCEPGA